MGHKVHPTGFRIGVIYDWQSKWFADQGYRVLLQEDLAVRRYLSTGMQDAAISRVEIERNANIITVTIHTAKPGIVIGRSGQKVDELRKELEALTGKRIRVNIQEIRMPELDAYLVARNIADQLERRVAFRRALRQTVQRTMARGAEGCKAQVGGRLGGAEMSRKESTMAGRVPLHTLRADIDYGHAEAATTFGRIGVKVWIYKGEKLPEKPVKEEATAGAARAAAEEAETPAGAAQAAEPPAAEAQPAAAAEPQQQAPAGTEAAAPEPETAPEADTKAAAPEPETAPADTEAAAPEPETAAEDAPAEAATEEEKPTNEEQG